MTTPQDDENQARRKPIWIMETNPGGDPALFRELRALAKADPDGPTWIEVPAPGGKVDRYLRSALLRAPAYVMPHRENAPSDFVLGKPGVLTEAERRRLSAAWEAAYTGPYPPGMGPRPRRIDDVAIGVNAWLDRFQWVGLGVLVGYMIAVVVTGVAGSPF